MKRRLSSPLTDAEPGARRAYDRLRRTVGGTDSRIQSEAALSGDAADLLLLEAVPASLLELDSRAVVRFVLDDAETGGAIDASFGLASRFTRHGATILDLQEIETGVYVEFLVTVEQAMFILGSTDSAPAVLERWLRSAGYAGSIRERIDSLTAALRERYAPMAEPPALPLGATPLDPRDWN